jgi:hypothetical protein
VLPLQVVLLYYSLKLLSNALNLSFTYSTEKQAWMQVTISDFNNSTPEWETGLFKFKVIHAVLFQLH